LTVGRPPLLIIDAVIRQPSAVLRYTEASSEVCKTTLETNAIPGDRETQKGETTWLIWVLRTALMPLRDWRGRLPPQMGCKLGFAWLQRCGDPISGVATSVHPFEQEPTYAAKVLAETTIERRGLACRSQETSHRVPSLPCCRMEAHCHRVHAILSPDTLLARRHSRPGPQTWIQIGCEMNSWIESR
jgi:hypothetical protein